MKIKRFVPIRWELCNGMEQKFFFHRSFENDGQTTEKKRCQDKEAK